MLLLSANKGELYVFGEFIEWKKTEDTGNRHYLSHALLLLLSADHEQNLSYYDFGADIRLYLKANKSILNHNVDKTQQEKRSCRQ